MEIEVCDNIRRLRREKNMTQEMLLLCQYFAQTKMSKNRTKGERAGQAGQLEGMCSILRQRSP